MKKTSKKRVVFDIFAFLNNVLRGLKLYVFKTLARTLLPETSSGYIPEKVDAILIYGAMGIGNMIMFTPTLKAIRQGYPDAHITLLVAQSGCEKVVKGSLLADEIIKAKSGPYEALKLVTHIRRRQFDLLISSFHGIEFMHVTLFGGIPWRIGHCASPGWAINYDFLYNIKVRMGKDEHEIDRGLRLAQALDMDITDDRPIFYLSEQDRDFAMGFLAQHGVSFEDLAIGVQADTWRGQSWKRWSPDRLVRVVDQLMERYGTKVIILGAPENEKELKQFLNSMRHQPIIALGKTTLKQSAAILEQCNFAICNDSGLMHISAAVGTPVVALYGPTDYHRTSPYRYGKDHVVLRKEIPCSPCYRMGLGNTASNCPNRICLDAITEDDVMEAAIKMIDRKNKEYRSSVGDI